MDPVTVRKQVQRTTGIRLREIAAPTTVGNVPNVERSYFGSSPRENLLVIVFDSSRATAQPLGPRPATMPRTDVIRHRNVLVFYTRVPSAPDRGSALRTAIAAT